jgi:hypothetical protein
MTSPGPAAENASERSAVEIALGDEYQIRRLLGRGGMGSVYLAHERSLDREVAVKVLHASSVNDDVRERFLREARTAARLTHPHIVPLHSFGHAEDILFYVMGYVDGESLEARLTRDVRIDPEEARRLLLELSDALDYAHRRGVVHRDIKPDNVLIERGSGRAVLTDFGIAKLRHARSSLTELGTIVGTPHYMSPEQASGDRALDGRSDLYSLGVLGYRMITGRLPFDAPTVQGLLAQHVTRTPVPVSDLAPGTPAALAMAIARCLAKVPAQRWPDAAAMRDALRVPENADWDLPEVVEHLPGLGVKLAALLCVVLLTLETLYVGTHDSYWARAALVMPLLFALATVPFFLVARRAGLPASRTGRLLFAPPRGWSGWWPMQLRRPGDVWQRLPRIVRSVRAITSTVALLEFLIGLPLFLLAAMYASRQPDPDALVMVLAAGSAVAVAVVAVMVAQALRLRRWSRRFGMDGRTIAKLLAERTWHSSFWGRADVAPLLTPTSLAPVQAEDAMTPSELALAIVTLADEVAPIDATLAAAARTAGSALAETVGTLEREVSTAARDVDHLELKRLEERLGRLNASTNPNTPGKRQMRELIERQIALMRQFGERHHALMLRRDALTEQMRALWVHLAQLRQGARDGHPSPRQSEAVRAIVADIDHLTATSRELGETRS